MLRAAVVLLELFGHGVSGGNEKAAAAAIRPSSDELVPDFTVSICFDKVPLSGAKINKPEM